MAGWWCARYRPLMPGIAVALLQQQHVDAFFPQLTQERIRRGRLVTVFEPLFSSYLFVRAGDELTRGVVLRTRGIRGLIMFGTTPGLVADQIIAQLKAREKDLILSSSRRGAPLFTKGQTVTILAGPLEGRLAVVDRMSARDRVRVLFSLFGSVVPADVPARNLKAVAAGAPMAL